MNWNHIDLSSDYETSRPMLDEITSDELLLCFEHNVRELSAESIQKEFDERLRMAVESARDVFKANAANYLKAAQARRAMP